MARRELEALLNLQKDTVTAQATGTHPIEDIEETFRNNIHAANRKAKHLLLEEVKNKLRTGVEGEGYDSDYAERKREDTGRLYGGGGPVDFRYSGRLWRELVGRGRAKPSQETLTVWLGLKHPNRVRPDSGPGGGGITYRRLAQYLQREKPGPTGNPFGPRRKQRDNIARRLADHLMDQD